MTYRTARTHLVAPRWAQAALVLAVSAVVTPAQAQFSQLDQWVRPGSVYGAASLGLIGSRDNTCNSAPTCEYARIGGKIFGGYRFTPNLAAEVAFYYLGRLEYTAGPAAGQVLASNAVASESRRNRAITVGFDWANEMFTVLTSHVRFGIARTVTYGEIAYGPSGVLTPFENQTKVAPYLGLGLSYKLNPHVRFYSSADVLRTKSNDLIYLMSLGLGIEN